MTPSLLIRPVFVLLAASGLGACGMVDSDPHRFETLAEAVAAIPLDSAPAATRVAHQSAAEAGLRPAIRVEVLDPHALWDARDAELNGMAQQVGSRLVAAAVPAVADAAVQQVSARIDDASQRAGLRPAFQARPTVPVAARGRALVQLGAYSSAASARSAWSRLKSGQAAWALEGLSPVYEAVEVGGRTLTRLKVQTPAAGAGALCAAAGVDDPWCRRTV